ncbi:hypothetical protein LOZ39_000723 [Ophidiomyces ophidiicola]|nr:hypothetical protein LOZ62_002403 [Ophidiomyces ophidiicola]KAI1958734.1 hypothetical protein LOZ59_003418 [Ophidiomyces ophidiicola]KAI2013903.1 hypothetical protein LOZ49_001704 [Ophidiomyces ophidiicola]KAI2031485.1 hypothetical protein LOZ48_002775 [Ophidiomyces ophidiicola]KAI2080646.1 hypothetical protein LOZ39_000723 [Ophidiomyces ophidiicola]
MGGSRDRADFNQGYVSGTTNVGLVLSSFAADRQLLRSDFTQKKANGYGLTGWVRNTTDGKVEGEAQGDDESVQRLLVDIAQGPPHAQVLKLENSEISPKAGDARFQVVR